MSITIISDVHGKFDEYYDIASKCEYTVQIGDFGFNSTWAKLWYSDLSPDKHKIIKGNHDQHDSESAFDLGDYGSYTLNNVNFFFVRGGLSIDRVYRVGDELSGGQKTYWSQEELDFAQMISCLKLYKKIKPDIVLTHVPPTIFIDKIQGNKPNNILQRFKFHDGFKENTAILGTMMLDAHIPKLWISGHHHRSYQEQIGDFKFVSLAELETYEIQ